MRVFASLQPLRVCVPGIGRHEIRQQTPPVLDALLVLQPIHLSEANGHVAHSAHAARQPVVTVGSIA